MALRTIFLEIQDHDIPEMNPVNRSLAEISEETGIPLVATNDAHYVRRSQARAHEVLLCIQTGKTITDPSRMQMNNDSYYLKSAEEMAALFANLPEAARAEALRNTVAIAERCASTWTRAAITCPRWRFRQDTQPRAICGT